MTTGAAWPRVRVDDVATIERDAVLPENIANGTKYVGLEHIDSEGNFVGVSSVVTGELASNKFRFGPKHILFGKLRPYLKKTARPSFQGICSTDIVPILPGPRVDRGFLFHFLRHPKTVDEAVLRCAGANLPRLSPRDLEALELPLPPLPEQRRIANVLDRADGIRRKRKEAIALTEELLRSAFLEMFGDPVTNPKGWPVKPLGTFLSFVTSGSRGWAEHYSDMGSRFIRSLDVQMDVISDEEPAFVVAPAGAEAERTRVRANDVLLTITGSKIGRAALVDGHHAGSYVSQHVAILRLLPGLDPDILAAFLVSERGGQRLIAASQYGQTKPGLNLEQIRRFPVPVPTEKAQRRLSVARAAIRAARRRQGAALAQTDALFGTLVQRAFRGELATPIGKAQLGMFEDGTRNVRT